MKKFTSHTYLSLGLALVILQGCNTNDFVPIVQKAEKTTIDLREINAAEITTTFSSTARQTMRFSTTESINNVGDLYFYATHDLATTNTTITNLIISVHGLGALDDQVQNEFNSITNGVNASNASHTTMILAPHFFHEGTGLEITWINATWRVGGKASSPTGIQLSSSQIVDYLLETYFLDHANFPNLKKIIIAGHSAGGQFSQRYASISKVETGYPTYDFNYITANASHYLYINSNRWDGSSIYKPDNCDTYDDYPYGMSNLTLDDRYAFISKIGIETIRSNYISRAVYYVLGDQDTFGATPDCESQSQQGGAGDSRYMRGLYQKQFMDDQYPTNNHQLASVAGVGHSPSGIYTSPEFIQVINHITQ